VVAVAAEDGLERARPAPRYPEGSGNPSRNPPGSVMTVDFTLADRRCSALNGAPAFTITPSIS
jgi:predicted 3-demethylubiquinone-9 3-methyltransferase (glyoxalase superfamily)